MFTHELSLKTRLIIGGSVALIGWGGSAIIIYRGLNKMKVENKLELTIIDEARKVVMLKAAEGYYDTPRGFDGDRFLSDYEFYKIAARDKLTSK
jgi:hypothetical protein